MNWMNRKFTSARASLLCAAILLMPLGLGLQGCSWFKKKDAKTTKGIVETPPVYTPEASPAPADGGAVRPPSAPAETPRPTGLRPAGSAMRVIYYDYDDSRIRPDQLEGVEMNLRYLKEHANVKVLVEGHCDERGTTEYNFALGERRARGIMDYFASNGIAANRLQILSKGEEEPVEPGHSEANWSKNRRCEFKFFD